MIIPKTVALDSSQWGDLIRDANSSELHLRREARIFAKSLLEKGYRILFSFHHLLELLAYENSEVVSERLRFIRDIEFLSWIGSETEGVVLGSILQIMAWEARMAYEFGGDVTEVRRRVKTRLIRSGSGREIVDDNPFFQALLSDWAQGRKDRSKASEAISAYKFLKIGTTVGQLKAGRFRTRDEAAAKANSYFEGLSTDISERGDRRITDPKSIAADFLHGAIGFVDTQPDTVAELVDANFLSQGIDRDEIHDHLIVTDLLDLGLFRSQLRTAIEGTDLSFNDLKRKISREQLPHSLLSNTLKLIQDAQPERPGSNLVDRELSCLAPYVDVLYVDKRTAEYFRQAVRKNPSVGNVIGDVRKVVSWRRILSEL